MAPDEAHDRRRPQHPRRSPQYDAGGVGRTLHDVARDRAALMVTCYRCKHRAVLYPHELAAKWGADFPLMHVKPRLKCTACELKGGASMHEGTR